MTQGNVPFESRPVYLDHHATTPLDPRVFDAMRPYFADDFGNAASAHAYGWTAAAAVETARRQVAALVNAPGPEAVVFTSGATEANTLALRGAVDFARQRGGVERPRIITAPTEHPAVVDPCRHLEATRDVEVTWLPVNGDGHLDYDALAAALDGAPEQTVLVSLMAANNEIGTRHDVKRIGELVGRCDRALFHCDAAQAVGKVPVDVQAAGIDLLTLSAHKLYGPKGVGALIVSERARRRLVALTHGGGHERGLRSGTLNVPGIVGLGTACELAAHEMSAEAPRLAALRDDLLARLDARIAPVLVNGCMDQRLPGNLNVSIPFVDGESLVARLRRIAVSSGSACASADLASSHVLRAIGQPDSLAQASLRFGLGRSTTQADIMVAVDEVARVVEPLRRLHPLWQLYETGVDALALLDR